MNQQEYFDWLVDQIGGQHHFRYKELLSYLFDYEFTWSYKIPTDANRAKDGQYLRTVYANETHDYLTHTDAKEPCNVLEMLVALAIRIENDITGEPGNDHPERWFWEMIKNLGIYHMTDGRCRYDTINRSLDRWMDRSYNADGGGGLFPLRRTKRDQRLVPIWDQMNEYLNEEYWKEN